MSTYRYVTELFGTPSNSRNALSSAPAPSRTRLLPHHIYDSCDETHPLASIPNIRTILHRLRGEEVGTCGSHHLPITHYAEMEVEYQPNPCGPCDDYDGIELTGMYLAGWARSSRRMSIEDASRDFLTKEEAAELKKAIWDTLYDEIESELLAGESRLVG